MAPVSAEKIGNQVDGDEAADNDGQDQDNHQKQTAGFVCLPEICGNLVALGSEAVDPAVQGGEFPFVPLGQFGDGFLMGLLLMGVTGFHVGEQTIIQSVVHADRGGSTGGRLGGEEGLRISANGADDLEEQLAVRGFGIADDIAPRIRSRRSDFYPDLFEIQAALLL